MTSTQTAPGVPPAGRGPRITHDNPRYKWIALSNTTLGVLMATINSSIVIISLPDIFRGIGLGRRYSPVRERHSNSRSVRNCMSG